MVTFGGIRKRNVFLFGVTIVWIDHGAVYHCDPHHDHGAAASSKHDHEPTRGPKKTFNLIKQFVVVIL